MMRLIWNTENPTLDHPNDEDLSLGTPKPKNKERGKDGAPAIRETALPIW
jgi:hypothetical protein